MAKGVFRSVAGKLVPVAHEGVMMCAKYAGKDVMVKITRPRHLGQHNRFFALRDLLWERTVCGEIYPSPEALRHAMIIGAGYYEIIPTKAGPQKVPKSMSFENMDDTEFDPLFAAVKKIVLKEILPHLTEKDLESELLEFAA